MQKILIYSTLIIFMIISILFSSYITIQVKNNILSNYWLFIASFIAWLFYIFSWYFCLKNLQISTATLSVGFGLFIEAIYFFSFLSLGESVTYKQIIGVALSFIAIYFLK